MNNLLLRRRALMGMEVNKEESLLPDGYEAISGVKLIENSATSPSVNISCPFTVKIECTVISYDSTFATSQYNCIFGANSNLQLAFGREGGITNGKASVTDKIPLNEKIIVEGGFNNDVNLSFYKINGIDFTELHRRSTASTYYILSGGFVYMTYGTIIHSIEIYKDDALTHKMLPCIRESENDYGLYDIINDVFINDYLTGA